MRDKEFVMGEVLGTDRAKSVAGIGAAGADARRTAGRMPALRSLATKCCAAE